MSGLNGSNGLSNTGVALGLSKDSDARQISTLLYCLGEEAEDVLSSTNISEDNKTKYSKVLEKLSGFFQDPQECHPQVSKI